MLSPPLYVIYALSRSGDIEATCVATWPSKKAVTKFTPKSPSGPNGLLGSNGISVGFVQGTGLPDSTAKIVFDVPSVMLLTARPFVVLLPVAGKGAPVPVKPSTRVMPLSQWSPAVRYIAGMRF